MNEIIAIDPGTTQGAFVVWDCDEEKPAEVGILDNGALLEFLRMQSIATSLYVEMIACYGMAVGKEVFETCLWIGRAQEIAHSRGHSANLVYRLTVKTHHCHSAKAKDANIRQALIDRFGPPGTKKNPGKLFGVSSHIWSALAIAVYASDQKKLAIKPA